MTECCPAGQTGLRMPQLERLRRVLWRFTARLRGASARTADQNLTCVFQTYGDAVLRAAYAYLHNMEDAQDVVRKLPPKYREPIHLFYHEGYQTAEIAKILGRKEATVRSDLHRGRQLLKDMLKEAYDFDDSV